MPNAISFFKPLLDDKELNKIEHDIVNTTGVGVADSVNKVPAGPQKEYLFALLALCRGQILDARVKINSAVQKFGPKPYFAYLLGKIAATKQQTDDAIWFFCMSISLQPDLPANYGELSYQIARPGRADFVDRLASHDQVLRYFSPLCFFARAQSDVDDDRADHALLQGAAFYPDLLGIWGQLAIKNDERVSRERALKFFQRGEYLNPSERSFAVSIALCKLSLGRYLEGWRDYEARFDLPGFWTVGISPAMRNFLAGLESSRIPRLRPGVKIAGKKILVIGEQGFGDTIQFARYCTILREKGARVTFAVQGELFDLFRSMDRRIEVRKFNEPVPACDYYISVMSLPFFFGTSLENIPAKIPYLSSEPALKQKWQQHLAFRPHVLRLGLIWQRGGTKDVQSRSIPTADLVDILQLDDVDIVCLQNQITEIDRSFLELYPHVRMIDRDIRNFADTAAIISNLDLVVTIDTSVAHLSGALGCTTLILLPTYSDARWLEDRLDSPWYPTAKLIRRMGKETWLQSCQKASDFIREAQAKSESS